MTTTTITAKGQVVIPAEIRRSFKLEAGTRFCVIRQHNQIILQPLTEEYFAGMAGILAGKKSLTRVLLTERAKEKAAEDKKWSRS
jgi:AbrB family looped-hinge helix DNA binding protein